MNPWTGVLARRGDRSECGTYTPVRPYQLYEIKGVAFNRFFRFCQAARRNRLYCFSVEEEHYA